MGSDVILILEDNDERIAAFESVVSRLEPGIDLRIWRDAHAFMAEAGSLLSRTVLVSLDHDLNRMPGAVRDPGDSLLPVQRRCHR